MKLLDFIKLVKPNYVPDWFHILLCEYLESDRDLLISTPPGAGKTELVSILFPTHFLCENPKKHVISLSNSDSLARLASSNILRNLMSPVVQDQFPLEFDKQSEVQFTIAGGDGRPSVHACGINGQVTGQRADLLIFDDPIKNQTEAYSETIREKVWANFLSCAETRLLPNGRIVGIGTRWHLDDPIGRLIKRATADKYARQFVYVSLAAWNKGEDSFILDTRTGEKKFLDTYVSLAKIKGQPYSFSPKQLRGKKSDLGDSRFSALYMQQPLAAEDQLFPPESWGKFEAPNVSPDAVQRLVTAWDCASKAGAKNDYSANVTVAKLDDGRLVVVDVWKSKVTFAELPSIALERYKALLDRYGLLPHLIIEDANAGTQLYQIFEDEYSDTIPMLPAKAVRSKIERAEGITHLIRAGRVYLLPGAEWTEAFVRELANFPVGEHDDVVDAFCHCMKAFVTTREFKEPNFYHEDVSRRERLEAAQQAMLEDLRLQLETSIDPEMDEFERKFGSGW